MQAVLYQSTDLGNLLKLRGDRLKLRLNGGRAVAEHAIEALQTFGRLERLIVGGFDDRE